MIRRSICLATHLGLTVFFWLAYQTRYGNHIDCFDERGRCFIPGEGVLTTGGAMWGLFAVIFAGLALSTAIRLALLIRRHRETH